MSSSHRRADNTDERRRRAPEDNYRRPRDDDRANGRGEEDRYSRRERGRDAAYGYGEHDRERERQRDRDRYDDQRGRSSRRSASPGARQSGSRSPSPRSKKVKPNFGNSGLLAAETNTVQSVDGKNSTVLKYNEPPEARKPVVGWRLYVFKGDEQQGAPTSMARGFF